jgi:hypothetical protein
MIVITNIHVIVVVHVEGLHLMIVLHVKMMVNLLVGMVAVLLPQQNVLKLVKSRVEQSVGMDLVQLEKIVQNSLIVMLD